MTDVKIIIARQRAKMETAGLLKPVGGKPASAAVAGMRPGLAQIQMALAERPDRFAVVQPSPMIVLFEITLPAIEHILVELGETRAEQIVSTLCEHGQKMIAEHGIEGAREHLEELYRDLPKYEKELLEKDGVKKIIDVYMAKSGAYLRFKLGDKIERMEADKEGMIWLKMKEQTSDADMIWIGKCKQLRSLNLTLTKVGDAGLACLGGLSQLKELTLIQTEISDAGLEYLSGLLQLRELQLGGTQVGDAGMRHLRGLVQLQELNLRFTKVCDAGLVHLRGLNRLRKLQVHVFQISFAEAETLRQAIPGISIES